MGSSKTTRYISFSVLAVALVGLGLFFSCGGSTSTSTGGSTGTVNTTITDPPSCSVSFDHVYVTITKVTASLSADASASDTGSWQTLADLTASPKQIDLLSLANTTCLLTQLGSSTLPAGKYQQIRLYLLSNNPSGGAATPANNACGGAGFNCVVPKGGSAQTLLLSSEAQTGIKIPTSQITNGGLTVDAGQATDLNIDFNTCSSLVHQGNGGWRLKPVLHAGEVSTNNNALSGKVVDSVSSNPIPGATVSLEQPSNGVDVVTDTTTTDANGNFSFCGSFLPAGAVYDIVVTKMDTSGLTTVTYNATVTLNVPVGSAVGKIPLVAEPLMIGTTTTLSSPANVVGQVTTTAHSTIGGATTPDATAAAIVISAFQDAGNGKIVTIPPFMGSSPTAFATTSTPTFSNGTSGNTCPTGTKCENYMLVLPASNPSVGTFTAGQTTNYSAPAVNPALYWVTASSTMPTDPTTADCTPSNIPSTLTPGASPTGTQIGVDPPPMPDSTVTNDFGFAGCASGQ